MLLQYVSDLYYANYTREVKIKLLHQTSAGRTILRSSSCSLIWSVIALMTTIINRKDSSEKNKFVDLLMWRDVASGSTCSFEVTSGPSLYYADVRIARETIWTNCKPIIIPTNCEIRLQCFGKQQSSRYILTAGLCWQISPN